MPVHGIDNGNNKKDVYTTEEVLSILQQAIDSGTLQGIDPDETPIVAAVRESHNNSDVTFWSGTEAEFNELTGVTAELVGARIGSDGKLYLLTGDTTLSDTVEAARQAALEATEGMKREVISVTLLANGWSNTAPYTQTVAVAGMTADKDFLAPYIEPTGNESDDLAAQAALSCISGGTTATDSVTFYCYDEKPTTTITVFMVDKGTKIEPGDYPIASTSQIGMVKVGEGLNVDAQTGKLSVAAYEASGYFFDNVAAMVAYNLIAGDTAETLGYYSANDGGGATYKIVSSGSSADGGSIIELSNGLKAQLIVENGTINVKQFGAKGDGTTADATAIRNALAFRGNNPTTILFNGGESYKAEGDFYINGNTTINLCGATIIGASRWLCNKDSVCAAGYTGIENVIIRNGTFNKQTQFIFFHSKNIVVENILFDDATVSAHPFDLGGVNGFRMSNCEFYGNKRTETLYAECIQTDYASQDGQPCWEEIQPNVVYDNIPTKNVIIENCVFRKKAADDYYLNPIGTHSIGSTEPVENVTVKGCKFEGWYRNAIREPYIKNLLVEDCEFIPKETQFSDANWTAAIVVFQTDAEVETGSSSGICIRNNKLISSNSTYDKQLVRIDEDSSRSSKIISDIVIEGNIFAGAEKDFAQIGCANGVTVRNNKATCKRFVEKSSGLSLNNLVIQYNIVNCATTFVSTPNGDTTANVVANYDEYGNIIESKVNGNTANLNTSAYELKATFSADQNLTAGNQQQLKPTVLSNNLAYLTSSNDLAMSRLASKLKVGGHITLKSTDGAIVQRLQVRIWDKLSSSNVASVSKWFYGQSLSGWTSLDIPELKVADNNIRQSSSTSNSRFNVVLEVWLANGTATIKSDASELIVSNW